jgi:hypothetical protein
MCSSKNESADADETPKRNDDEKAKDVAKTVDRLIDFWIHQNTLLWSRLQTLAALQVPVLAGCYYFLWINDRSLFALLIAILGASLSVLILLLIKRDVSRRDDMQDAVWARDRKEAEIIFPVEKRFRGSTIMKLIVWIFLIIDVTLASLAGAKLASVWQ